MSDSIRRTSCSRSRLAHTAREGEKVEMEIVEFLRSQVALVDLDGTLADFDGAMKTGLESLKWPGEPPGGDSYDKSREWLVARKRLIKSQPGFWSDLKELRVGFDVVWMLESLKFEIHILTKGPESATSAWTEKVKWCQQHLGDRALITITQDKSLVYGRVLVDDWPGYIAPWLEHRPRGLVIMPAQDWNKEFAHPNVLRYDGTAASRKLVYDALKEARDR